MGVVAVVLTHALVFLAVAALDFCWAAYIKHVGDGNAWQAATWSAVIAAGSAFTAISYVGNHWTICDAVLGAFAGTWLSVRRKS